MKQTRFIPTNDCGLQLREPQEGQQESREIEGRPIVFGVRSVNLTPWSSTVPAVLPLRIRIFWSLAASAVNFWRSPT